MTTKTFKLDGMGCDMCRQLVERTLLGQQGVLSASASVADACVTVEYDSATAQPEAWADALREEGYTLCL